MMRIATANINGVLLLFKIANVIPLNKSLTTKSYQCPTHRAHQGIPGLMVLNDKT